MLRRAVRRRGVTGAQIRGNVVSSQAVRRLRVLDVVRNDDGVELVERTTVGESPAEVAALAPGEGAEALVLWDVELQLPPTDLLERLLDGPCHVWHAGLRLGQADRPAAWNLCHGRAMFSCDVDPSIESTSWKLSLRAVVVRNQVIDAFGGFDAAFDTPSGAALEAGLRWITHGALMRHVPDLLPMSVQVPPDAPPSPADGLRIVRRQLGTKWVLWTALSGLRTGAVPLRALPGAAGVLREPPGVRALVDGLPVPHEERLDDAAKVTVLVPTVGRYPYVEKLLGQLSTQTVAPHEVIVVDQNPPEERRDLTIVAPGLPLRVLFLQPPGQCSARNTGLRAATGTHILFLDDDDEVPDDLLEQHLRVLSHPEIHASCGLVDDRDSGPAGPSERYRKASGVFPTNNAMIRREVLERTGLFDPTYDRGARADHDLGMRAYLTGHLLVHDPRPQLYHHHAPMGGLRTHGARVRTRRNSRSTLVERHLRTSTDIYLGLRYYSADRVDEDLALSLFSTLGGTGSAWRKLQRLVIQLALLPRNRRDTMAARREGERLYRERPELPQLDGSAT